MSRCDQDAGWVGKKGCKLRDVARVGELLEVGVVVGTVWVLEGDGGVQSFDGVFIVGFYSNCTRVCGPRAWKPEGPRSRLILRTFLDPSFSLALSVVCIARW